MLEINSAFYCLDNSLVGIRTQIFRTLNYLVPRKKAWLSRHLVGIGMFDLITRWKVLSWWDHFMKRTNASAASLVDRFIWENDADDWDINFVTSEFRILTPSECEREMIKCVCACERVLKRDRERERESAWINSYENQLPLRPGSMKN